MSEPLDINRRLTDDEIRTIFTSPMVSLTETYEAIAMRFEVTRARREEDRLRLALETANARALSAESAIAEWKALAERWEDDRISAEREWAEAQNTAAFLLELLRATVRTGTKDPLLDARLAEELRSHE